MKERIRRLRLARGMTLQQVASHFGISAASVSSWERGASIPDGRKLARLADVLGTSVQYLVDGATALESSELAISGDRPLTVPFVAWELLDATGGPRGSGHGVPVLHTTPSADAFATRYPGGATGIGWQPGLLPPGALVVVEPARSPQPGDLAVLLDRTGRPFVGTPVSGSDVEANGPRYRDYASGANHSACTLLGRIVEWRISSNI